MHVQDEPLDSVARRLCTTVEILREFELFGWIYTINRNGRWLLPAQLAQKTKLIVRLRRRKLTSCQIGEFLALSSCWLSTSTVASALRVRAFADGVTNLARK